MFFLKITTALLINLILLLVVCHNDFPGVNAPIEIRQKWAYKEFSHYPETVNFVKNAEKITEKVGEVKFVAPTQGRNLITNSTGSGGGLSLQDSLYTLEVVGEKATGIAYIRGWRANYMYKSLCFEYQGKKTQILSGQDSKCGN